MNLRTTTISVSVLGLVAGAAATAAVLASTPATVSAAAATARPELISAAVGQTTSNQSGTPAFDQTTVVFNFDEQVAGVTPVAADFHLVGFDSNWRADGQSAAVQSDGRSVLVTFGSSTGPIGEQQITDTSLATVSSGAVSDGSLTSPDGAVPLGSSRTVNNVAGETTGPDLIKVDNIRSDMTDPTHTLADFTFDMPVYPVGGNVAHLVLQSSPSTELNGTVLQLDCSFSGSGTATLTAACNNPDPANMTLPSVTTVSASQVARGFVDAGAVSADPQNPTAGVVGPQGAVNVLESTDVSGPGSSPTPYLKDVIYHPGVSVKDGNGNIINADQVIYVFDQAVAVGTAITGTPKCALQNGSSGLPTGACFDVYTSDGRQIAASNSTNSAPSVDGNPPALVKDNPNDVVATFPAGTLSTAAGAAVADNAVTMATGAKSANLADEMGMASPGGATITPGTIDGPVLTAVEIDKSHSPASVNYVFNEDLKSGSLTAQTIPDFYLLGLNGDQYTCQTATQAGGGQPGTNNSVTCTSFAIVDNTNKTSVTDEQVRAAVVGGVDHNAILFDNGSVGGIQNPEEAHAVSDPPSVQSVSPTAGPDTGGAVVTVIGSNFAGVTKVTFGDTPAPFTISSPTELTATAPAHQAGPVDITVTSGSGISPQTPADVFYYQHGNQAPLILAGPSIEGANRVGSTETCNAKLASGVSSAHQWTLDGVDIPGATNVRYRIAEGAVGRMLACRITATTANQLQSATSRAVRVRLGAPLRNTAAPRIKGGQPRVGHYSTASTGSWSPAATFYRYHWYVGGKRVAGATAPRYLVRPKDRGKSLVCRVTAGRHGWQLGHARTKKRHIAE